MKLFSVKNIFLIIVLIVIILLSLVFLVTRPFFLRNVVLPQLSKVLGLPILADEVELYIFDSKFVFKNVKIGMTDDPLIVGKEVSFNIDITQILQGKYTFDNVYFDTVGLILKRDKNKKWNLPTDSDDDSKVSPSNSNLNLSFSNININNCFINVEIAKKKNPFILKLKRLNIKSSLLQSNINCPLSLDGRISISSGKEIQLKEAVFDAEVTVLLNNFFVPKTVSSKLNIDNIQGRVNEFDISKINISFNSEVSLKNDVFKALDTVVSINDTPIHSDLIVDLKEEGVYPYNFSCNFENLTLSPYLKYFIRDDLRNDSVIIKKLEMKLTGKASKSLETANSSLNGYLNTDIEEISLPGELSEYPFTKLVFVPLDVFSMVRHLLPDGFGPDILIHSLDSVDQIFTFSDNIYFDKSRINITIVNGEITLNEVFFMGKTNDLIKHMVFSGKMGLNKNLQLNTKTNIRGLIIPVVIYGTHLNPQPDIRSSIKEFVELNGIRLLDPLNICHLIKNSEKGVEKAAESVYNNVEDIL